MKYEPRLNVSHLFSGAREAFQRRPGLCMAMFFLFSIFSGNGGGGNGQDNTNMPAWIGITWVLVGLIIFLCSGAIRGGYDMAMLRLHRGDGYPHPAMRGQHDHRDIACIRAVEQSSAQAEAVEIGHLQVGHDNGRDARRNGK